MRPFIFLLFLTVPMLGSGQQMYFSDPVREENEDMRFDILGKSDSAYVIYKKVRWKHIISCYDKEMKLLSSKRIGFLPEKTVQLDPVMLPSCIYLVYQYQKGTVVYCCGARVDNQGNKLGEPVILDTTRVTLLSDNRIYSTIYSENRKYVMVYKMHMRGGRLTVMAKLFNANLEMKDSSRLVMPFDEKKEYLNDPVISNDGTFFFVKQFRERGTNGFSAMQLYSKKADSAEYAIRDIPQQGKLTNDVHFKPDNLNGSLLINCFYFDPDGNNVAGIFSALLKKDGQVLSALNAFDDSVRYELDPKGRHKGTFNNLFIRNEFLKRNGSFILVAENCYSQGNATYSDWNRWNNLYNYPSPAITDYYLYNPYYYGLYRPPGGFYSTPSLRYYYEELLVAGVDSSLQIKWNTIIRKKQYDDDNENYLSFANYNAGAELHFIFAEENVRNQVLSDHSITPSGRLKRYPALKSFDKSYSYMPRLARQVGSREMIMPCVYLGGIVFARLVFDN